MSKQEDEKRQYNAVRVPSSQYTSVVSAYTSSAAFLNVQPLQSDTSDQPNKKGVSIKHDSYARYINKRKAFAMAQRDAQPFTVPVKNTVNNKQYKHGVGILGDRCDCKY
jgi:aspartyl aminopeptidase